LYFLQGVQTSSGSHPAGLAKGQAQQFSTNLAVTSKTLVAIRVAKFHTEGPQTLGAIVHHGDPTPGIFTPLRWIPGHLSQEVQRLVQDADR
jgi:hypothetical protein